MARYQKRLVELRNGQKLLKLEIEHGHVYESSGGPGIVGHVLYDEKEETALLEKLVRKAKAKGFKVVADTGMISKTPPPKKPVTMTAKTWRWVQDADEMLRTWREEDYDNLKDAILDARSMLAKAPSDQAKRIAGFEKILAKATKQLTALAASDPSIAAYARGLLPIAPAKKKTKKKTVKKTSTRK